MKIYKKVWENIDNLKTSDYEIYKDIKNLDEKCKNLEKYAKQFISSDKPYRIKDTVISNDESFIKRAVFKIFEGDDYKIGLVKDQNINFPLRGLYLCLYIPHLVFRNTNQLYKNQKFTYSDFNPYTNLIVS